MDYEMTMVESEHDSHRPELFFAFYSANGIHKYGGSLYIINENQQIHEVSCIHPNRQCTCENRDSIFVGTTDTTKFVGDIKKQNPVNDFTKICEINTNVFYPGLNGPIPKPGDSGLFTKIPSIGYKPDMSDITVYNPENAISKNIDFMQE